jgi:AcrR family transcriptional regulator
VTTRLTTPTLRTYSSSAEQEQTILGVALEEFVTVGVRRANMDEIAKAARVSRSTLYRRFPNKDALLAAVVEKVLKDGRRSIVKATLGKTPHEAVSEALGAIVRYYNGNPGIRTLISDPIVTQHITGLGSTTPGPSIWVSSEAIATALRKAGAKMPDKDLQIASEVMIRIFTSLARYESVRIDLSSEKAARQFAKKFLAPLVW